MSISRATKILLNAGKMRPKRFALSAPTAGTVPAPRFDEPSSDPRELKFALSYLDAFGYFTREIAKWKDISYEDILLGVQAFQKMFGLADHGELCTKTIRAMEAPRCGCPDAKTGRQDHQKFECMTEWSAERLPAWRKRGLVYTVTDYVPNIPKDVQDSIFDNAFAAWTRYGNIEVRAGLLKEADIVISTGQGPRSNFDGPGGTLAWAYMPNGSDQQLIMRFDLGETWVAGGNERGIVLGNVATHEIGHLFGLDHSRIPSAIMAPYYNAQIATPQMQDDVPRFQARYGIRPNSVAFGSRRHLEIDFDIEHGSVQIDGRLVL